MMSSGSKLQATLLAAIAVQTIGAVDPYGQGKHLPAPRMYVAIVVLWGSLGLLVHAGGRLAAAAGNLSLIVLMTMALLGPFGKTFIDFLNGVAEFFSSEVVPAAGATAGDQFPQNGGLA